MERQLIKYLRKDKTKEPKGIIVSFTEDNKIYVGYSLCSKRDAWDKELGFKIAINRAYFYGDNEYQIYPIAQSAKNEFVKMIERSERFFKGANLPSNIKEIFGSLNV